MKKITFLILGIIIIVIVLILLISTLMKTNQKVEEVEDMANNEDIFANKEVKITVAQAREVIAENKDLLILDTRTQEEYNAGHIEGAILIPYNKIEINLDQLDGFEDKPILVYCRTGSRSAVAVDTLIENGFNKIYHMNQGFSRWK
jgi:rhodanese-related sulfurtransferase